MNKPRNRKAFASDWLASGSQLESRELLASMAGSSLGLPPIILPSWEEPPPPTTTPTPTPPSPGT